MRDVLPIHVATSLPVAPLATNCSNSSALMPLNFRKSLSTQQLKWQGRPGRQVSRGTCPRRVRREHSCRGEFEGCAALAGSNPEQRQEVSR